MWNISKGKRSLDNVRKVELEALVDTGATFPALPNDKVEEIGLPIIGEGEAEVAAGREKVKLALGITQIEDGTAGSYIIVRPKSTTTLIGVVGEWAHHPLNNQLKYNKPEILNWILDGAPEEAVP